MQFLGQPLVSGVRKRSTSQDMTRDERYPRSSPYEGFPLQRGQLAWVNLGFPVGSELGWVRPLLVVHSSPSTSPVVWGAPLTSKRPAGKRIDYFVEIEREALVRIRPPKNGASSWVDLTQLRAWSKWRILLADPQEEESAWENQLPSRQPWWESGRVRGPHLGMLKNGHQERVFDEMANKLAALVRQGHS